MKIKYLTVEDSVAAQEGFWTKLQHTFTRDAKSASIVGDLIERLQKLKSEDKIKFEKTVVDFACPRAEVMMAAVRFVGVVVKFMVDNFEDIKKAEVASADSRDIYKKLNTKMNAIRRDLDRFYSDFSVIIDDQESALSKRICFKGRTFYAIGFTVQRTLDIAKQFQKDSAGNLNTLRKARWGTMLKAGDEINKRGIIGEFAKFYDYSATAMKLYKKIDYFLFYTSKVVKS